MYLGIVEYYNNPNELQYSQAWNSSIRSTSSEFTYYSNSKLIFLSDFVSFLYTNKLYPIYLLGAGSFLYTRRVLGVGKDIRTDGIKKGIVIIEIQEIYLPREAVELYALKGLVTPLAQNEGLLFQTKITIILEAFIGDRKIEFILNYFFSNERLANKTRPTISSPQGTILIRRVYDLEGQLISPLCKTYPIRAELELKEFSREHLEQFNTSISSRKILLLQLLTFINGFGLYRNTYYSIIGIYFIPANISISERN